MNRQFFSIIVMTALLAVGFVACKKKNNPDDKPGDGSTGNPFKVANVADLKRVGTGEEGPKGLKWERNKHYRQVADINLNGESNWTPVCPSDFFSGTYDGGGYTISNLTISRTEEYSGLFGKVSGKVANVRLDGVEISGRKSVGSVAGIIQSNGTIEYCSVNNVNISATWYMGGIAGDVVNTATVNSCMVTVGTLTGTGTVQIDAGIGGITGNNSGTIKNCYTTVDITGLEYVGGIAGFNSGGSIQYCYAIGRVNAIARGVGGIAGQNSGKILNCVALNPDVKRTQASTATIGRITGENINSGTTTGNYARAGMALTADVAAVPLGTGATLTGIHGENVSEPDYTNGNADKWWSETAGFPNSDWLFGASFVPRLKGFDKLLQDPMVK